MENYGTTVLFDRNTNISANAQSKTIKRVRMKEEEEKKWEKTLLSSLEKGLIAWATFCE